MSLLPPPIIYQSNTHPDGPTIVLTCLNHGDEVIGVNTAFEILEKVKSSPDFCGKLVIFPALNQAGFWQSSRFFMGQNFENNVIPNLNRVWPGDEASYAGLLAKEVFSQIVDLQPDLVVDMHSYGFHSIVHIILDRPGGDIERGLIDLSKSSKVPFYLEYSPDSPAAQAMDKSLSNQLCLKGIPSITLELGPKGSFSVRQAKIANLALLNTLIAAGSFTNDEMTITDLYKMQNTQIEPDKTYFRAGLRAGEHSFGYFRLHIEAGKLVQKGELVATVIDLEGNIVEQITMPETGYFINLEDVAVIYPKRLFGVYIKEL